MTSCGKTSSSISSNSSDLSSSSNISSTSELKDLSAVQIKDVYNDHEFKLEEFPDVTFRIGPRVLNEEGSLYVHPLYVNDVDQAVGTTSVRMSEGRIWSTSSRPILASGVRMSL